jgi:hypothetical protein
MITYQTTPRQPQGIVDRFLRVIKHFFSYRDFYENG